MEPERGVNSQLLSDLETASSFMTTMDPSPQVMIQLLNVHKKIYV